MSYKSGFIAIIGKPNVGKSSLINAIIGEKVCITSPKPQTTRNKILGIYNTDYYQMIFVDTPGVQNSQTALGSYMAKATNSGASGADAVVVLLDATSITQTDFDIIGRFKDSKVPVYVVINKIDIAHYERVYPVLEKLNEYKFVKKFFAISALKKKKLDILLAELETCLPEGEPLYDTDIYTDRPIKFIAVEVIREKALLYLQQEIPHGIAIELQKYMEGESQTTIFADIICESDRHKQIIIGAKGQMLKNIGSSARRELEQILKTKVTLKLFVKVKPDWKNSKYMLSSLGYDDKDL